MCVNVMTVCGYTDAQLSLPPATRQPHPLQAPTGGFTLLGPIPHPDSASRSGPPRPRPGEPSQYPAATSPFGWPIDRRYASASGGCTRRGSSPCLGTKPVLVDLDRWLRLQRRGGPSGRTSASETGWALRTHFADPTGAAGGPGPQMHLTGHLDDVYYAGTYQQQLECQVTPAVEIVMAAGAQYYAIPGNHE